MKHLKIFIGLGILISLFSCDNKRDPQVQYMPDMYESIPYKTDGSNGLNNMPVNRKPVAGTIPRSGQASYDLPNTPEGYEMAKAERTNPLEASEENLENGKAMYEIYCATCHGKKGDGNGWLVQNEKFLGVPNYKDRDINSGTIYHVLIHGKNLMGSHSGQLTYKERWQVAHYVEKLRSDLMK